MKKTFSLIAAVLMVLSFAGAAFAIHAEIPAETQAVVAKSNIQITLGGEIRTRGWYTKNLGGYDAWEAINLGKTTTTFLSSLTGGATVWGADFGYGIESMSASEIAALINDIASDEEIAIYKLVSKGKYGQKTNSKAWYDQRIRLSVDVAASPNVTGRIVLESDTAADDKYVWGEATGNGMNTKAAEGMGILEAWIQYTGSGLFGFPTGIKVGHMPLKLSHAQFFDHTQMGNDAIVFFMDPTKALHVGLLTIKLAEGSTLDNTDDVDAYVGLFTYKLDDKNTIGANYTYLNNSDSEMKLQNLGLHAAGSMGNFGYKAEVDFQFGDASKDTDASGFGIYLAGNYNMAPVNLRASFALGSGDDNSDNDVETFQTFVGSVQNYTLIYDYLADTTRLARATGISNTTYYNLGLDYAASKDLSFSGDFYLLRATETGSGISKKAGWELDAKMKYMLAKNLSYQIDAGYFKPGKFYEDSLAGKLAFDGCYKAKGVTVLRNMLTLSF